MHCISRQRHDAVRYPLGGFRCRDCGVALADLAEAGTMDSGYVDIHDPERARRLQ